MYIADFHRMANVKSSEKGNFAWQDRGRYTKKMRRLFSRKGIHRRLFLKVLGLSSIGLSFGFPFYAKWGKNGEGEERQVQGGREMIMTSSDTVFGRKITRTVGLVRGSTVRARHVGKDILAGLRNIVGGEVEEYTKLLAEAREQAVDRMKEAAKNVDANAIVGVRFVTSSVLQGASEMLVYGTAVVIE